MMTNNRHNGALWFTWLLWGVGLVLIVGPYWLAGLCTQVMVILLVIWLIFAPAVNGENMFNRKVKSGGPADGTTPSSVQDAMNEVSATASRPGMPEVSASVRRCTMLAAGTEITGDVVITGDCQVCGHITGTVTLSDGELRVMRGGRIDGDVLAPSVTIDGSIHGTCDADQVEILGNGYLDGTCRSRQFSIVSGGVFTGQSERRDEPVVTDKDAEKSLSGTVTDLPSRRARHASPADTQPVEQTDG